MSDSLNHNIKLVIADEVYQEVMFYIDQSDYEVSGFGSVEVEQSGNETLLHVRKVFLLDQENMQAHTEIDEKAMGKLEHEFYKAGITDGPRWWWHSHVQMGVFWSGEDVATLRQLSGPGWICATVFNQKEERRSCFAQGGKDSIPVMIDHIPTQIVRYLDPALEKAWAENYKEKCKNVSWSSSVGSMYGGGGGGSPRNFLTPSELSKIDDDDDYGYGSGHWHDRLSAAVLAGAGEEKEEEGKSQGTTESDYEEESETSEVEDVCISIFNFALEVGLGESAAERYCDAAARLMEDGRYTPTQIEEMLSHKMMDDLFEAHEAQQLEEDEEDASNGIVKKYPRSLN